MSSTNRETKEFFVVRGNHLASIECKWRGGRLIVRNVLNAGNKFEKYDVIVSVDEQDVNKVYTRAEAITPGSGMQDVSNLFTSSNDPSKKIKVVVLRIQEVRSRSPEVQVVNKSSKSKARKKARKKARRAEKESKDADDYMAMDEAKGIASGASSSGVSSIGKRKGKKGGKGKGSGGQAKSGGVEVVDIDTNEMSYEDQMKEARRRSLNPNMSRGSTK